MAQGKIFVETSRLDGTADQVDRLADEYEGEYNALFQTVQNLQAAWSGEDNVALTNQIEGFRDDLQRMTKMMRDYAAYLRQAAASYRDTQDNVAAKARTLSQGNSRRERIPMPDIKITFSEVGAKTQQIRSHNEKLSYTLQQIKSIINALEADWTSDTSDTIRAKITGMQPKFDSYKEVIESYF